MASRDKSSTNTGSNESDLLELARCLRQERIFVCHEKKQLQNLNERVLAAGRRLAQAAWVAHMQRENLENLVLTRQDSSPHACCQRANLLMHTQFVDAYKQLSHHMVVYSEFLVALRNKPCLVAVCLDAGDRLQLSEMQAILEATFCGSHGSCLLREDEQLMMSLLKKLVDVQVLTAANPRKMLRHKSSFSWLFKSFSDQLGRLFLTAALYDPILQLLTDDDIFLDIDPSKALIRFSPEAQLKKFGQQGSPDFEKKVKEHRRFIIQKLADHVKRFLWGIQNNFFIFPAHLSHLLRYVYRKMTEAGRMESKDIFIVCVDILFTLFICPAIVDPEPLGVIDMPISYIARFNLMQVAQIIQSLALWKWEEISPHLMDLYGEFEEEAVSRLVESLLEGRDTEELNEAADSPADSTARLSVLLTVDQLQYVADWLRTISSAGVIDKEMEEELQQILAPLPASVPGKKKSSNSSKPEAGGLLAADDPDDQPQQQQQQSSPASFSKHKAVLAAKLNNVGSKVRLPANNNNFRPASEAPNGGGSLSTSSPDRVLVIPINDSPSELPGLASEESILSRIGSAAASAAQTFAGFEGSASYREESLTGGSGEVLEKRTRFSLSHDEGSIGNTSDNLEAISEAASNHSVASSLEDEVDQVEDPIIDNLSDMVSANVSGRGTPNVSGRDTPSSQVTEGDEPGQPAEPAAPPINRVPPDNGNMLNRKSGEPDMEERFGRFEIKPEMRRGRSGQLGSLGGGAGDRDEAVSMVSDTWSTDVIGSDTETVGEPPTLEDLLRGRPGDDFHGRGRLLDQLPVPHADGLVAAGPGGGGNNAAAAAAAAAASTAAGAASAQLMDGETGSEWSMDVLASDSESFRLRDFDLEDSLSVSRSDDTRFTDDANISEADHLIQRMDLNYYEDGTLTRGEEGGTARVMFPVKKASVEEWAELSRARNSESGGGDTRRDSDASAHSMTIRHDTGSILKKPSVAQFSTDPALISLVESSSVDETDGAGCGTGSLDSFPLGPIDNISNFSTARLSTTSIASSASSHCSATSVEVSLQQPGKASQVGVSGGAGGVTSGVPDGEARLVLPPVVAAASTGAIPKSISFDKTADKDEDGDHKQLVLSKRDRNFFKWKLPKIGRSRGGGRGAKGEDHHRSADRLLIHDAFHIPEHSEGPVFKGRTISEESRQTETSDDILAKYRKAPRPDQPSSPRVQVIKLLEDEVDQGGDSASLDLENPEKNVIFQNAKRKLRLMLSEMELPPFITMPDGNQLAAVQQQQQQGAGDIGLTCSKGHTEVLYLLRIMLAQALNQQDRSLVAQLHETIRCMSTFDEAGCRKLVSCLREEYHRRSPYIAYLVRSRQGLLSSLSSLQKMTTRMEAEQRMSSRFLICVCVRLFLERHEQELRDLRAQFSSASVMDERTDLVVTFLDNLMERLAADPMLAATNEEQREEARIAVERAVFSQIYMAALHPNQEADISRDRVLHQHIARLRGVVTPGHRDLKIPRRFQYESPWPSAQAELKRLAAYKLPQDKVSCVSRVATIIMNLLSLALEKSVPAADDFLPVLVYVIIQANPPDLLSTVQFVNNFYGSRLSGEENYWWMQFTTAIEFIKTMDYQTTE